MTKRELENSPGNNPSLVLVIDEMRVNKANYLKPVVGGISLRRFLLLKWMACKEEGNVQKFWIIENYGPIYTLCQQNTVML